MQKQVIIKLCCLFLWMMIVEGCETDRSFRFALLSDIHIADGSTGAKDLRAAVHDINALGDIEFVLVSGDITEMDIDGNLDTAKVILEELDIPYHIIPGNHDTKWTDSGALRFDRLFKSDRFSFRFRGYRFIGLHQGPLIRMGDGLIASQDLNWLDSLVTDMDPHLPVIWVTHYPVDESISNVNAFLGRMNSVNSVLVLHGHGHRNRLADYAGIPGVMGRSVLRAGQSHGGYNLITIADDTATIAERVTGVESLPPWAKVALKKNDTKTFYDLPDSKNSAQVGEKWRIDAGYTITASAVADSNAFFLGDASGQMHAFDLQNGIMRWSRPSKGPVYSTAAVDNDAVIFASTDGTVRAFVPGTGDPIWETDLGDPVISNLVIDGDQILVGSSNKGFYSLDKMLGKVRWHNPEVKGYIETKPLLIDNKLVFGTWKNKLYALDRNTGDTHWIWQGGTAGPLYSPAACWPVAGDKKIFVVAPDRYMTAIDKKSGDTIWRSNRFMVRESIGISEDHTRVFVKTMRDTIVALSTRSDRADPLWITDCDFGYEHAPSMLMETNGSLYFGTRKGEVFCLNSRNGKVKWVYKIDNSLVNTVTPIDSGSVIATTMSGTIVLLEQKY